MNNNFLSLPAELLLIICYKLDLSNLKNLRLSCKPLAERLSFLVLSNIRIKAESIEDLVSHLNFLTNPPSVTVNCTTRISIQGFGKNPMLFCRDPLVNVQNIRDTLFTAVTSFKAVRTVRWFSQRNDPLWLQESIWSAIRCLPALRALSVEINLEHLNTLIALESISISGQPTSEIVAASFENVSKLYASSTNLVSIELDGSDLSLALPEHSDLYHLLAFRPKVDPAIRLRRLALSNIPVRMDENTLHRLNNLTSLKLSLTDVESGSPDKIWNALRLSKIHLQELDIRLFAMGDSVNDYLSSFSGLKKLRLHIDEFDDHVSVETSAVKFWSSSLLNHVDTLQDLSVRADQDGRWCFGDHNRSVIAKCTKLKTFTITVYPIPTQEFDHDGITPLIETVLTHMPHIEYFGLDVPLSFCYRGIVISGSTITHLQSRLKDWISKSEPSSRFRDRFSEVVVFLYYNGRKWLLYSAPG